MLSKKSFGIAGAAMLGTVALLGTNAANAAMNLDDDDDGMAMATATVTFAQETVTATTDDDGMYYMVSGNASELNIMHTIGIGAIQDGEYEIVYELTGMVFSPDLMSNSIMLGLSASPGDNRLIAEGQRGLQSGGMAGDKKAVFEIAAQETEINQTDILTLQIPSLGVMAGGGSVKVTVNRLRTGQPAIVKMADNEGMVKFAPSVVVNDDGARNAMTYVVDNYMNLGPGGEGATATNEVLVDDVGGFSIGIMMGHLNAADGSQAVLEDVFGEDAMNSDRDVALMEASITFDEDMFDFAEEAWLQEHSNPDSDLCAATSGTNTVVWGMEDADSDKEIMEVGLVDLGVRPRT